MKISQPHKIVPSMFMDLQCGAEFTGKLKGFRPVNDYWIGVLELTDIPKPLDIKEFRNACMDFIFCKKSEKTLSELLELKQLVKEKKLKLLFKGISSSGFPIFFHEFI